MFQCQKGHSSKPGEKGTLVVTQRRDKTYVNERGRQSEGWEIVEERQFCADHALEHSYLGLKNEEAQ
jgi:hypothetical protein